jgi:hypothetical protein
LDALLFVNNSSELSINTILRLKHIILSVSVMHRSLVLRDAFDTIIKQSCEILNCDRASLFLVDRER